MILLLVTGAWKEVNMSLFTCLCRNKQFAAVENPGLWNWTFTLTDDSGGVLAEIDRNWRGFGFEVILFLVW